MARVFLSYAREDSERARELAEALEVAGHQVWWDHHIHGGSQFADEIDRALTDSETVVVLWSTASTHSTWVLDEAAEGRDCAKLVPVLIQACKPPLGYRQFQCIDLTDWSLANGAPTKLLKALDREPLQTPTQQRDADPARRSRKTSICVLPFENMSGDPEQEYFSDGISEDIITDLSAFTFKGKAIDIPAVARQLNVTHVLEGSVRKAGGRVRITAQLIDGQEGDHLWADRWDRELADIFELQDDVSAAIVHALKVKLLPEEKKAIEQRGTSVAEAYDLYLLARQQWVCGNEGDSRRDESILRICQRAIELDPQYAQAWALMALVQMELKFRRGRSQESGIEAAQRALSINPELPEGHAVIARHLATEGKFEEAWLEIEKALRLDPNSWEVNREAATIAFREGRIAQAAPFFERAAEMMETDYFDSGFLAVCYTALRRPDDARRAAAVTVQRAKSVLEHDGSNAAALGHGAYSLALLGESARAQEWTHKALMVDPDNLISRYRLACAHAVHLNDTRRALELLEPYFATCSLSRVLYAERDPDMASLISHPEFAAMIESAKTRLASEPEAQS